MRNSKFEIRNSKETRNPGFETVLAKNIGQQHHLWLFGFRVSNFGFPISDFIAP
jgi:hypothetical protein